ncbi:MAG: hypothetical protein NZ928_05105 [Endomicrobia bacterium]|nr:hypothetical protein [Endomicrobiia bacterium]MDW8055196.1 hypothetical protein [Elusimicrobiota bacterium]
MSFKVLKFKFACLKKHLYLCGFIITNVKLKSILRISIVSSCNPAVFEINIDDEIKKVENLVYRYKLEEGNIQEIARKLVLQMYKAEEDVYDAIQKEKSDAIERIVYEVLNIKEHDECKSKLKFEIIKSEKIIEEKFNSSVIDAAINKMSTEKFFIKAKPIRDDRKGFKVEKIKPKTEILFEFTDNREIAKNIMHILFSKNVKEFSARVCEIKKINNKYYEIICAVTPTIMTKTIVDGAHKLVVKK